MDDEEPEAQIEERSEARETRGQIDASGERVDSDVHKLLLARIREKVRRDDDR